MSDRKRVVRVLDDINEVLVNDRLRDYEILLNYNELDFCVIFEGGKIWSVKKEIAERLNNKLGIDHLKNSNAHNIATEDKNGFMSSDQCKYLNKLLSNVEELQETVRTHVNLSEIKVNSKNIYVEDDKFKISANVFCGLNFKIQKDIDCPSRPSINFINNEGEIGYRKDIIVLKLKDKIFDIEYYEDIAIISNKILINNKYYNVEGNKLYSDDGDMYHSLYVINVYNDEYISDTNINGKISNSISKNEILDIFPSTDIEKKEYKTNIKETNYNINAIQCYIPLNGDEYERKTKQFLNKTISYKNSPFGLMMKNSINEGNVINFDRSNQFNFEFMIDTEFVVNETLVTLFNNTLDEFIKVTYENGFIFVKDSNSLHCKLELPSEKFSYIRLSFNKYNKSVQLNINEKYNSTLKTEIDITTLRKFQINACKTALGQILLVNGNYHNNYMSNKIKLIETSNHYGNTKIFDKKIQFKLSDDINDFNVNVNKSSNNKLNPGDYIIFNFNRKLSPIPYEYFSINDYIGNRITVNNNNFEKDDMVIIENNNEIFMTSIISIDEITNELILEEIPKFNMLHHKIYNVTRDYSYFNLRLKNEDELLGNIYKINGIYTLKVNKEIPLDSEFIISFKEIIDDKALYDNSNEEIEIVLFDNLHGIKSNQIVSTYYKNEITLLFNGTQIDNEFLKEKINLFKGDDIELTAVISLGDLFNKSSIDISMVYNITNISAEIELSSGSNPVIINGKEYNRGNILSKYRINKEDMYIDLNAMTIYIKIQTKKDITEGKLLLKTLNFNFSLLSNENIEIYYIVDNYMKITDYLIMDKSTNDTYINSDKEITLITEKKVN